MSQDFAARLSSRLQVQRNYISVPGGFAGQRSGPNGALSSHFRAMTEGLEEES